MSSLTKAIEEYITQLFNEAGSHQISLRRKELAERFGCVPSQINYVLRSRFAPEQGFVVESQRGGHGYIRIVRLRLRDPNERVEHLEKLIGRSITEQESKRLLSNLEKRGLITPRERLIIEVALRNQDEQFRNLFDVPVFRRDTMRADLLKRLITSLALM
ncbi:transcriptional repressor, CtsR [Thermanaerovibrio acidaminovorans DSM 6589]|uniref:Transcriptional repressor, CtsR n=1 Tax=Thermanaerovibrio acidaminovorans (strain ATCC 49978 / DSM 6589 / Su883) TaxID=525903 RepID=D1B6J5_THEAS|nr:CtsR family transcriptional regulator [Thermanaerovibrio acidaminovorans]ACZ19636.1 transcriptional repressor, CtsR [Thermanaerovibrio acidaminovorans DSM 6589]